MPSFSPYVKGHMPYFSEQTLIAVLPHPLQGKRIFN